jgi:hypothetical protein
MGNEAYLTLTYFLAGLISFCLGLAAYGWLCHPLGQIVDAQPGKVWGQILKKSFPITTIVLALSAFMSVSYSEGCPARPYERILADRAFLLAKNQQQISATLSALALGVFLWALIILVCLLAIQPGQAETRGHDEDDGAAAGGTDL